MKDDYVRVIVAVGGQVTDHTLRASKAGRTVTTKYTTKWLEVTEASRPTAANPKGRPVGNSMRFRLEAVAMVEERRQEATNEPVDWQARATAAQRAAGLFDLPTFEEVP